MPEREQFDFDPSQAGGSSTLPRSFFQSDAEWQQYLAQMQRSQTQVDRITDPYGPAAQQRGYNNYDESKRVRDAEHRRFLITHGVLPTLGFIGGGYALAGMGGGGAAGAGAASSAGAGAAGAGGATGAGAGLLPATATASGFAPYAGSATMVGTGLGGGAAGAAGAGAAGGFMGLSARELASLGLSLGGTIGGAMSGGGQNMNPTTQTSDPNLQALMQSMQRRLDKSEPLYDSVLNMANGLLPTQYQKGGGGMG
jgi:hypothetical protein